MAKGKKKKSKKKDAALVEQNTKSLRRILKLYDQYSAEQNSVACTEVTRTIRSLIEEGESLSKVKFIVFFLIKTKRKFFYCISGISPTDSCKTN
jgi:hypothetical protein